MSESNQSNHNQTELQRALSTIYQEVNLDQEYQLSSWSKIKLIPKGLLDKLPFGRVFSATRFYQFTDRELPLIVEEAQRTWAYWLTSGIVTQEQLVELPFSIFYNESYLWFYHIPFQIEEIKHQICHGN